MPDPILCKICGKRRARRACPAVGGDICAVCCGTEREVSLLCPLECPYLREAHLHQKPTPLSPNGLYSDITVTQEILARNPDAFLVGLRGLYEGALATEGVIDADVLRALESLIETRRTLESGLIYQHRPENRMAARIQEHVEKLWAEYVRARATEDALHPARESDLMIVLVALHRIGQQRATEKPRSRSFFDELRVMEEDVQANTMARPSGIVEPAPSIIL